MDFEIGIVCGRCETYAPLGSASCGACGHLLMLERPASASPRAASAGPPPAQPAAPAPLPPALVPDIQAASPPPVAAQTSGHPSFKPATPDRAPSAAPAGGSFEQDMGGTGPYLAAADGQLEPLAVPTRTSVRAGPPFLTPPKQQSIRSKSIEELMDQAKNFVCRSCSTPVPMGHKFCGRCGAAVPPEILNARTQFFGQLQAPGKAKLILIRGEGVEGLSYQLNAEQHVVGRSGQLVFADDPFVSPKHANFFYRGGKLVVRDEGSLNGVYVRVRGTVDIVAGDSVLAGEQVFRIDATPKANDQAGPDGTFFYSSPKHQSPFRIVQLLQGGAVGMTVCARSSSLQIGREGGDLNFPSDLYMSAAHCKIEDTNGKLTLTDMNSRNGTYLRLKAERELAHGDYVFVGRKLLRVEITAA